MAAESWISCEILKISDFIREICVDIAVISKGREI